MPGYIKCAIILLEVRPMIKFNEMPSVGIEEELSYLRKALENGKIGNNGEFTKLDQEILKEKLNAKEVLLTTNGSSALVLAAMLLGIGYGDEVIMPSFTFSTTAASVVDLGAVPVFVDIRPDTMNIDEEKIEAAITGRTKAITVVHYAGVGCNMERVMEIARKHNLYVIEDAAQVVNARYHGKYLGTFGDIGCFSFHETKNYAMGEGGAVLINREDLIERAHIVRECGTDRIRFINGQVDKYTWVDMGTSFSPSELCAAYLYPQLLIMDEMKADRVRSFDLYKEYLSVLEGKIELPTIPEGCDHNAHMFYIKVKDIEERVRLQKFLREKGVDSAFHYIPLHSAIAGRKYGRFVGEDVYTTKESERLLRLPMYYQLKPEQVRYICDQIIEFYK